MKLCQVKMLHCASISQVKSCLRCKYTAIEHISINKA